MPHADDVHDPARIFDRVDDAIVSDPDAPQIAFALKLPDSSRPRTEPSATSFVYTRAAVLAGRASISRAARSETTTAYSATQLASRDQTLPDFAQRNSLILLALFGDELVVKVFPDLAMEFEIDLHGDFLALVVRNELNPFHAFSFVTSKNNDRMFHFRPFGDWLAAALAFPNAEWSLRDNFPGFCQVGTNKHRLARRTARWSALEWTVRSEAGQR